MAKEWRVLPPPPPGFGHELGLPAFQAHLLYNRGIRTRDQVSPFLNADRCLLNDPLLLPDMEKGVTRLQTALSTGETIGIFGDFDTDGVTGTAVLQQTLEDLGGSVVPYIPDRVQEGHGLNEKAIRTLRERGVTLLVTVDCGSTDSAEIDLADSLGMDTVVTDHHTLGQDVPHALALINPKRSGSAYPYESLAGVGLSFKLADALYARLGRTRPDHLFELVALGTIADVSDMTGENRYLVRKGLEQLRRTNNPGIQALAARAGIELGSMETESLAFGLIPRLNVAGRLGHAGTSLALLTARSLEEAQPLADELDRKNQERQTLTARGVKEAQAQVEETVRFKGELPAIVVVSSPDWIRGILGLIAGRLVDQLYRPAVAVCIDEGVCDASARSIPQFDIVAALHENRELFTRYGGHPRAAGFSMPASALPALKARLEKRAGEVLRGLDLAPKIEIDCEVDPGLFAEDGMSFIQSLEPFGVGNPAPVFVTRGVRPVEARRVGGDGQHLKLRLSHDGTVWDAIAFRQGDKLDGAQDRIDVVYNAGLNTWGGRTQVQLNVLDFRPSS